MRPKEGPGCFSIVPARITRVHENQTKFGRAGLPLAGYSRGEERRSRENWLRKIFRNSFPGLTGLVTGGASNVGEELRTGCALAGSGDGGRIWLRWRRTPIGLMGYCFVDNEQMLHKYR
jgi:hypothetical protein